MKLRALLFATSLACASLVSTAAESPPSAAVPAPPERAALECSPRTGLPNFFARVKQGGNLFVAYLGGSITAQAGWRVTSLDWLRATYPQAHFSEINAAIGGTGSDLGVLRLDHDVLASSPDLVFVEFAVNDAGAAPQEIIRSMEGIVRKTWKKFPACDICFVYTFSAPLLADLKAGKFNRSAATMELVADRYGIPTIHLGLEAVKLEAEGKLVMKGPEIKSDQAGAPGIVAPSALPQDQDGKIPFSPDGVHPHLNTGHRLYLNALVRSIPLVARASVHPGPHILAAPLDARNYENTVALSLDGLERTGPWQRLPKDSGLGKAFASRVDSLWLAAPGAELHFKFKGTAAKIYDLLGPDCGLIEVTLDGKSTRLRKIDGYCTYSRLSLSVVGADLDPTAMHDVRIRVLDEALPKGEILFEANRPDLAKNPQKYAATNWYAGNIFLVGELVP